MKVHWRDNNEVRKSILTNRHLTYGYIFVLITVR